MSAQSTVGLLFGGANVEHEVSVESARNVARAMASTGLRCVPLGVTGEGVWLSPERSRAVLESDASRVEADPADPSRVAVVPGTGLCRLGGAAVVADAAIDLDALFPLIHGWGGEDGRAQGALELAGLPYVGSGVLGSAVAMDKAFAKRILETHGIPGVAWQGCERRVYRDDPKGVEARIVSELGLPVFVKPANGGSSVGVSRVDRPDGLAQALSEALDCDARAVIERAVNRPREVECAVLGNDRPEASVLGEIVPSGTFYDYAAKYVDGTSELIIPAKLAPDVERRIRDLAVSAFEQLDLAGFARVDFLLDGNSGQVYLNEVNTLPGFTAISMFPRLWEASGLPYSGLIERLVELALERAREQGDRRILWRKA